MLERLNASEVKDLIYKISNNLDKSYWMTFEKNGTPLFIDSFANLISYVNDNFTDKISIDSLYDGVEINSILGSIFKSLNIDYNERDSFALSEIMLARIMRNSKKPMYIRVRPRVSDVLIELYPTYTLLKPSNYSYIMNESSITNYIRNNLVQYLSESDIEKFIKDRQCAVMTMALIVSCRPNKESVAENFEEYKKYTHIDYAMAEILAARVNDVKLRYEYRKKVNIYLNSMQTDRFEGKLLYIDPKYLNTSTSMEVIESVVGQEEMFKGIILGHKYSNNVLEKNLTPGLINITYDSVIDILDALCRVDGITEFNEAGKFEHNFTDTFIKFKNQIFVEKKLLAVLYYKIRKDIEEGRMTYDLAIKYLTQVMKFKLITLQTASTKGVKSALPIADCRKILMTWLQSNGYNAEAILDEIKVKCRNELLGENYVENHNKYVESLENKNDRDKRD